MKQLDMLIRVRVTGMPDDEIVPVLQIVTKSASMVEILGMGQLDDAAMQAAWERFRKRAYLWDAKHAPTDYVKFDLIGHSKIADLAAEHGAASTNAARQGGPRP